MKLHAFLNLALIEVSAQLHAPATSIPGKESPLETWLSPDPAQTC